MRAVKYNKLYVIYSERSVYKYQISITISRINQLNCSSSAKPTRLAGLSYVELWYIN